MTADEPTPRNGFIVVAVLWVLGALSALLSIYTVYVIDTAVSFSVYDDRLRAESLVSAALELTAYRQLAVRPQDRPTHDAFRFRLEKADVAVAFRSETARIDLNAAPKPLLVGLFLALGVRRDLAELYANNIIGWRTAPQQGQNSERTPDRSAGLGYEPRHAKFPHVAELALVRDLPPTIVERTLPLVTVFSGRPQINILDAAPEVIASLPDITPQQLKTVLAQRQAFPNDGKSLLSLLGDIRKYATIEAGNAFRININITFDNGQRTSSEVAILIFEEGPEPYAVLSWHDNPTESPSLEQPGVSPI
jgi:general secretion pathway protein K